MAELALDDPEQEFDLGTHARFELFDFVSRRFADYRLAQPPFRAVGHFADRPVLLVVFNR